MSFDIIVVVFLVFQFSSFYCRSTKFFKKKQETIKNFLSIKKKCVEIKERPSKKEK